MRDCLKDFVRVGVLACVAIGACVYLSICTILRFWRIYRGRTLLADLDCPTKGIVLISLGYSKLRMSEEFEMKIPELSEFSPDRYYRCKSVQIKYLTLRCFELDEQLECPTSTIIPVQVVEGWVSWRMPCLYEYNNRVKFGILCVV